MMSRRTSLAACVLALATFPILTQCNNDNNPCHSVRQGSSSSSFSLLSLPSHNGHPVSAQQVVAELGLTPNPERGYYVESFRDSALLPTTNRSVSTAIYYLLEGPDVPSVWHRVDAAEVWHYYAGAPLVLQLSGNNGTPTRDRALGPDLFSEVPQRPQVVVPGNEWQRAISCGNWTLVGTTVAPAFVPEGYELAPDGWEPNDGQSL